LDIKQVIRRLTLTVARTTRDAVSQCSRSVRLVVTLALLVLGPRAVVCVAEGGHLAVEINAAECCRRALSAETQDDLLPADDSCGETCRDSVLAFIGSGRSECGSPCVWVTATLVPSGMDALHNALARGVASIASCDPRQHGSPSLGIVLRC